MVKTTVRERIETRLRARICSVCIEAQPDGSCGLPPRYPCALFRHLDRVINAVTGTRADSLEVYSERLRQIVCSGCRLDEISGDCRRPDDQVCPLEMYFPMIVEIIETEIAAG